MPSVKTNRLQEIDNVCLLSLNVAGHHETSLKSQGYFWVRAFSGSDSNCLVFFFVFRWNASPRHLSIELFLTYSEKTYVNMINLLTKENVTVYQQRRPETLTGIFSKRCFSMSSLKRFTSQPILEPHERFLYQNLRKTFHTLKMQITTNLQNVVKTGFVVARHKCALCNLES